MDATVTTEVDQFHGTTGDVAHGVLEVRARHGEH